MKTTQQLADQYWEEALQQEATLCQHYAAMDIEQEYFTNYNNNTDELV